LAAAFFRADLRLRLDSTKDDTEFMALQPIGVLDLSIVTGLLIKTIEDYWDTSPLWQTLSPASKFTVAVSALTPEEVRTRTGENDGCQLTVSLIHIEPDRFNRNFVYPPPQLPPVSNPPPPRAQMIPALPLALDLFYFVTAWFGDRAIQEQQAMSIVLNCFHQNPILRTDVLLPGSPSETVHEEFTLTMEIESVDSISRFWQAVTAPFRLSLMYKVSVVFLTPPAPPPHAKQVSRMNLAVETASFPLAPDGQVFGTSSSTSFIAPDSTVGSPRSVDVHYSPATVTPGQRFFLNGAGLNQGTDYSGPLPNPGTSYLVNLRLPPDYKVPQDVSAWKTLDTGSPQNAIQTNHRVVLDLPASVGPVPGGSPPPGVYLLEVAGSASPSNSTPISIAARVDPPAPPALPILTAVGGTYTVNGMGFVSGSTEVLLDSLALTAVPAGPLSAGQFTVASTSTLTFNVPANFPTGLYSVRIRVNQVESPPAVWIKAV
jgi:Pvc16 N-terminal domain